MLQMIAEILQSFGRAKKCLKIYGSIRIESMRASFKSMETDYLRYNSSSSIDKLEWTALEDHVAEWLEVLRKTVKVLVSSERKLCNRIFQTFDIELWTDFFQKLVLGSGMKALIEFGEAVALSQREPQKLFKLLDMVEGLERLKEDFVVVFEGPRCLEIRLRLSEMEKHLVHSACQVLWDFGKQVEEDSGLFVDGSPPKLTSYVVNYLKFMLTEYEEVMAMVWGMENNTSLAEAVSHVMDSLELSLETRATGYNASGLSHIFLMNNYWYIFKRARDSKLGNLLGEAWLKQRKRLVNQHVLGYEKEVWVPLVKLLSRDGLAVSSGGKGRARDLFKQRIRSFNSAFEKLYEEHKNWLISDEELREGTFTKIEQAVIAAYRNYIENFSTLLDHSTSESKHLRYTPEQLGFMLSHLFTQRSSRTG